MPNGQELSRCVQARPTIANQQPITAYFLFIETVLWIARTGSPWRDLPKEFGKWNSVFQRYRRWGKAGRFARIFEEISGEADMEYAIIDGSIVKVHRHG